MQEKLIEFETANPVDIFGVNNANVNYLKKTFPKLKIIARGTSIKVVGTEEEILRFEQQVERLVDHYRYFNKLTLDDVKDVITNKPETGPGDRHNKEGKDGGEVIVFGSDGEPIKARSIHQKEMVREIQNFDMMFAIGPAGTGKTYTSVAMAVRALKNREVKRIILTRPAVEAGENLGFLPGDLKEKLDPYLQPLYDALRDMIPADRLAQYLETGVIQIAPLAFMRGRTLDHAFVILDEAQNATQSQLKMFLTRMGRSAKFIITGDLTQVDLPKKQSSGLAQAAHLLREIDKIKFIYLDDRDVIRHGLVKRIIEKYEELDKQQKDE